MSPSASMISLVPDQAHAHAQAPEQPPIGLKLKKSASLVDLINAQLGASASSGPCPMVA